MPDIATTETNATTTDPLADLGLSLTATTTQASAAGTTAWPVQAATTAPAEGATASTGTTAPAAAEPAKEKQVHEHVNIGELVYETVDLIPAQKRGGGGGATGSKYGFDKLVAPVLKDPANPAAGWNYATVKALLQEGVEADKLKRSVQSAVSAENRRAKEAKEVNRCITRAFVADGEFKGVIVFRVDDTLAEEEEEKPDATKA